MREQVVTPRVKRAGAPKAPAGQGRAASRRDKAAAPRGAWRAAASYLPLALKLVLAVALGTLFFTAYRSAASASFFGVKSVDVEGARRASREEIGGAVRQMARAGVWRADLELIAAELRSMPWVRDVVVSRVLPSGLRVRVREREPRVIARTSAGRLVWVDDDGVVLGGAQPDEDSFFVRGLDEERTAGALERNRERVALALELEGEWRRLGLARRVSEINLGDLRDIRVQLSGDDSKVEVRLGSSAENLPKAIEKLDASRREPFGGLIEYVNVANEGRRIIIGYPTWVNAAAVVGAAAGAAAPAGEAPATPAAAARRQKPPQRPGNAGAAATRQGPAGEKKKKEPATRQEGLALRPRRVG